jgi:hypothetical protein
MKRDPRLAQLSREHTQALMLALRFRRELPTASSHDLDVLYSSLIRFWAAGLLPHFRAEGECLLARLVRHVPAEDERVRHLQVDHLRMAALVASMRDTPEVEERRALLLDFGETIATHVHWEEQELFAVSEELLSSSELDAVGHDLDERLPRQVEAWDAE